MDGVTEGAFLRAMSRRGWVSAWVTPFLRISTGVPRKARLQDWLRPFQSTGLPVIAQLMGISATKIAATAERLAELGVRGIDLNCACPSPTVIGHGGGGARLKTPEWLGEAVAAVRQACAPLPVSLKIRTGFASATELPAILRVVKDAAPDLLTIHFRTVKEMYAPVPDGLERLREARSLLPEQLLFGSGDLFTPDDALRMLEVAKVDGLAPARGLLRNPALIPAILQILRGQPSPVPNLRDKLEFLHDLACPDGLKSKTRNGFVLRMTRNLFGEESALFRELSRRSLLRESWEYLGELLTEL
jgi:tRNA-dihydrouridine synthase C